MKKKILIALLSITSFTCLSSCSAISDEFETLPDKLWPNVWVTLATIIAFLIMILVVFLFAYKPVKNNLKKRQEYIEKNIQDSKKALDDANVAKLKAQEEINDAHKKAGEILNKAQEIALDNQKKTLDETNRLVEIKQEQAREDIQNMIKNTKKDISKQVISNSIDLSKEILQREINKEDNDKIVNDFIDKLDKELSSNDKK